MSAGELNDTCNSQLGRAREVSSIGRRIAASQLEPVASAKLDKGQLTPPVVFARTGRSAVGSTARPRLIPDASAQTTWRAAQGFPMRFLLPRVATFSESTHHTRPHDKMRPRHLTRQLPVARRQLTAGPRALVALSGACDRPSPDCRAADPSRQVRSSPRHSQEADCRVSDRVQPPSDKNSPGWALHERVARIIRSGPERLKSANSSPSKLTSVGQVVRDPTAVCRGNKSDPSAWILTTQLTLPRTAQAGCVTVPCCRVRARVRRGTENSRCVHWTGGGLDFSLQPKLSA